MNFRTKIWTLPLSAACVFIVGVAVCVFVGARISSNLGTLQGVDSPYLERLLQLDRGVEQFRLTLQSAASEGDDGKLKEAEGLVASIKQTLASLEKLDGKSAIGAELSTSFNTYQSTALGAVGSMLKKADLGDQLTKMQATQAALDKLMKADQDAARTAIDGQFASIGRGVLLNIWVSVLTGVAALLVLGIASWFIIKSVWRDLGGEPTRLRELVQKVADGDLEVALPVEAGDTVSLNAAAAGMVQRLRATVRSIRDATDSISTASNEIATGNLDLSTRTEHTASNLQQAASSMEQLTGTVRQSAESAQQANQLAASAGSAAERGGAIVSNVVTNMEEINTASRKINEIIGVIDGIAFQTNILALNAAVEAARAGEQGRGFAVVASEVRSLAQRSAQAAKEIKTLISASSEKVESGARLVQDAGNAMQEIVSGVQRFTDIIGEISAATSEQSRGIDQVNQSVTQLDQMTQQNAALVEESAAAASSLKDQAGRLAQAVSVFRVDHAGTQASRVIEKARAPSRASSPATSSAPKVAPARKPLAASASLQPASKPAPMAKPAPAPAAPVASKPHNDDWETF